MDSIRDKDGDRTMEDIDPYNTDKYSTSTQPSPSVQRTPARLTPTHAEMRDLPPSSAASSRMYSPMNTSPPSPYGHHQQNAYASSTSNPGSAVDSHQPPSHPPSRHSRPAASRLSPGRQPPLYYTSSPTAPRSAASPHLHHQLPPLQSPMTPASGAENYPQSATAQLNAVFGRDAMAPTSYRSSGPNDDRPGSNSSQQRKVPRFVPCANVHDLEPRINTQPLFRRAHPEGGFISPLQALTTHLPSTYRICNPSFQYESSRNPRRVLTKPSKGTKNDGYDNDDSDYILYVNDILGSEETNHKNRYLILDVLGQGTFGQVVKCQNLRTQEVVAVKVVKNRTAYFNQSMMEVSVLDLLNSRMDKNDDHHILRLKDTFIHRQHLCLVFELLSVNLYELIKQNQFRGLSTTLVRVFAQQLLNGLCLLSKARLIHCDLKPENILLKNLESPIIKIIDFGSACDERQTVYTYIQSRFYRSPEVLLGLPYSAAIDMWSLGCIVVELFLGLPLFPGSSEYNQVSRITEMLGLPPTWMLEVGKQSGEFFDKSHDDCGRRTYRLKSMEQYSREHGNKEQPSKKYFSATTLPDIIRNYPMPRKGMKQAEIDREMSNRVAFIDFVHGLLNINPLERWTPQQARTHPFITQQKFTGPFQPQMSLKTTTTRSPAPGLQQQQQAEALSKQRAQAAQQQVQQTQAAVNAAYAGMHMQSPGGYQMTSPHAQQSPQAMYGNAYNPMPPGVATGPSTYGGSQPYGPQQVPTMVLPPPPPAAAAAMSPNSRQQYQQYAPQYPPQQSHNPSSSSSSSLYAQATTRAGRQRAYTTDIANGIPAALQRVVSHLDPNAPIRSQPSPAYYPPSQLEAGSVGGGGGFGVPPPHSSGGGGAGYSHSSLGNNPSGLGSSSNQPNFAQGGAGGSGGGGSSAQYDSRRASRGRQPSMDQRGNFVRQLEDRSLEEGWVGQGTAAGSGGSGGGGWA